MIRQYSIVIHPPLEIMNLVGNMKQQLGTAIGWFHSKNSKAHITICEFCVDDEKDIPKIKLKLLALCRSESSLDLHFNSIGNFSNGAIYISPNQVCNEGLKKLMLRFQKWPGVKLKSKSESPHISIARKLSESNLIIANQLFKEVDFNFICDRIVLRIFDEVKKQYTVDEEFIFKDEPAAPEKQLMLF